MFIHLKAPSSVSAICRAIAPMIFVILLLNPVDGQQTGSRTSVPQADGYLILTQTKKTIHAIPSSFDDTKTKFVATYAHRTDGDDQIVVQCQLFFREWKSIKQEIEKAHPKFAIERVLAIDLPQKLTARLQVAEKNKEPIALIEMNRNSITDKNYFVWEDDKLAFSMLLNEKSIQASQEKTLKRFFRRMQNDKPSLQFELAIPVKSNQTSTKYSYAYRLSDLIKKDTDDEITLEQWQQCFANAVQWKNSFEKIDREELAVEAAATQELEKLIKYGLIKSRAATDDAERSLNFAKLNSASFKMEGTVQLPDRKTRHILIDWAKLNLRKRGTFIN